MSISATVEINRNVTATVDTGRGPIGPQGPQGEGVSSYANIAALPDYPASFPNSTVAAATSNDTASTIVFRDGSSSFSARQITLNGYESEALVSSMSFVAGSLVYAESGGKVVEVNLGLGAPGLYSIPTGPTGTRYFVTTSNQNGLLNLQSEAAGILPIENGGTGATSASAARTALGLGTTDSPTFAGISNTNLSIPLSGGGNLTWNFPGAIIINKNGSTQFVIGGSSGNYTNIAFYSNTGSTLGVASKRWGTAYFTDIDASGTVTAARMRQTTSAASDPTTTEYPTSGDWGVHKNTSSGDVFLAYNDGGTIKKVQLT